MCLMCISRHSLGVNPAHWLRVETLRSGFRFHFCHSSCVTLVKSLNLSVLPSAAEKW